LLPFPHSLALPRTPGAGTIADCCPTRPGCRRQRGNPTIKLRGTVVDASSKPVAGATVEYWQYAGTAFQPGGMELKKKTMSSADGAFEFQGSRGMGILLAQKPGLAPPGNNSALHLIPRLRTTCRSC